MSEPSTMKLRTIVMLASIVALPMAAVMGLKLPSFLSPSSKWSGDQSETRLTPKRADEAAAPATRTPSGPQSAGPSDASGTTPPTARFGEVGALPETPSRILPVGATDLDLAAAPAVPASIPSSPSGLTEVEEFTQIQQRLRALGATHYMLETWGSSGEAYRFQCRMAAGHDAHYSRHFEATDVDSLRAMRTVLGDVEAWKSGRLP